VKLCSETLVMCLMTLEAEIVARVYEINGYYKDKLTSVAYSARPIIIGLILGRLIMIQLRSASLIK